METVESHGVAVALERCTARSKQSGTRCRQYPVPGHHVCHYHGARAGAPIKHGRYSKVRGRIAAAIQESHADATLLDLRKPVAVLDALEKFALERAEDGDTPQLRTRALKLLKAARADKKGINTARLDELDALLTKGIEQDRSTRQLGSAAMKLIHAQESAWTVKLARKNSMSLRDAIGFMGRLVDIVRREVDPVTAARIEKAVTIEMQGSTSRASLPAGKAENTA